MAKFRLTKGTEFEDVAGQHMRIHIPMGTVFELEEVKEETPEQKFAKKCDKHILDIVKEEKEWPRLRDKYYTINCYAGYLAVTHYWWTAHQIDKDRLSAKNCFRTEQEAQKAADYISKALRNKEWE